jgi:hypothetical protein
MMRHGTALALMIGFTLPTLASARDPVPPRPPAVPVVEMEDQFERPHNVASHRGDVVVLIYGDRKSADANKALGELLHVHFHPSARGQAPAQARQAPVRPIADQPAGTRTPDVLAIPVACVGKVPALVRRMIRGQIKGGSPEVPVWLDFEDVMKGQFAFTAGVPNVVVLDAQGRFRYAAAGQPTPEGTKRLLDMIEGLRREAVGLASH